MDNTYIIVSKMNNGHDCFSALGHEIHLTRFILYDLLQKNKIDINSVIVTLSEDRFFLYRNIFKNLLSYNNFIHNKTLTKKNIIDLSFYSPWNTKDTKIDFFNKVNYSFEHFEKSEKFISYINDIEYSTLDNYDFIHNIYFLLCVRFQIDSDKLHKLINKLHKIYDKMNSNDKPSECNIVIYGISIPQISIPNIHIINNLQTYASFLNNNNCKVVISEWSGGGQLSQYCNNNNIIYYFDNYPSNDYEIHSTNYENEANNYNNIFNCWDFKSTTNCKRLYYKSLNHFLENDIIIN